MGIIVSYTELYISTTVVRCPPAVANVLTILSKHEQLNIKASWHRHAIATWSIIIFIAHSNF